MTGPLSEPLGVRAEGVPASLGCHIQMSRCVFHENNEKGVFHSHHFIEVFRICILTLSTPKWVFVCLHLKIFKQTAVRFLVEHKLVHYDNFPVHGS